MIVCPQCSGIKYVQNGEGTNIGNNVTFTEPKAGAAVILCPTCLGNGYSTGSGT